MTTTWYRRPRRVLVVWNQVEDDIYETWQAQGAIPLPWDRSRVAASVRTVQQELDELVSALRDAGHDVTCVNIRDDFACLLQALHDVSPDVVFNLVEYFQDDTDLEASVVGLFELLGYAYTGCAGYCLSLCQHKHHTKLLLEGAGLPTPAHFVVPHVDAPVPDAEALRGRFPFIVKPAKEDASGGIERESVVESYDALLRRLHYVITEFEQPALVEQYIEGREIHAAILGNEEPEVLPFFEMCFDQSPAARDAEPGAWQPRIISYSGKWDPLSRDFYDLMPTCPAPDIPAAVADVLHATALHAYRITGCRDYARIDMRVAEDGTPYVLEVNPNPDLTNGSAFIMCAVASGRTYSQTLDELVQLAAARISQRSQATGPRVPTDHLHRKYWQPPE